MIYAVLITGLTLLLLWWVIKRLGWSLRLTLVLFGVAGILVYLTVTGKMNWLFTLAATVVLAIWRLLRSPLGFLIIGAARRLFSLRRSHPAVFRSESVVIRIDPFSGVIDGDVLCEPFVNHKLSQLTSQQIDELLNVCQESDPTAARFIGLYQRYLCQFGFGGAHQSEQEETVDQATPSDRPDINQACEILGVGLQDNWKTIVVARQRLLSRLHPDKGGSAWVTRKINAAWEVVRAEHPNSPDKQPS